MPRHGIISFYGFTVDHRFMDAQTVWEVNDKNIQFLFSKLRKNLPVFFLLSFKWYFLFCSWYEEKKSNEIWDEHKKNRNKQEKFSFLLLPNIPFLVALAAHGKVLMPLERKCLLSEKDMLKEFLLVVSKKEIKPSSIFRKDSKRKKFSPSIFSENVHNKHDAIYSFPPLSLFPYFEHWKIENSPRETNLFLF
jgi:hypothetical protein